MKKSILTAILTAMLIVPGAYASSLGAFVAYWDTKDAEDEFGAGVKLQLPLDRAIALELRASIFEFKDEEGGIEVTLDVIPLEAGLIFSLAPGKDINPYIGGGAGYYIMDGEVKLGGMKSDLDVDNEVGYYAVGGIEVKLGKSVALFVEAKYTWLKIKKVEGIDADAKLDGIGGNAGLLLRF